MDKKKLSATASSTSGKHGEKKDENFLTKTAHSIRDKVHDLTDEVKEKTHNLTHSSDSKKNKKSKTQKSTDTKLKTSSKPATAARKKSSSDSDDEDDSPKPPPRPTSTSGEKKDNEPDTDKLKPSTAEKKDAAPPARSKSPSDKPPSSNSSSKPSDDHKDSVAAAAPPSSTATKPSDPPSTDATDESSPQKNNTDQVHISFDGVATVDDLLDRIDEAIEKAKIVVEGGNGKSALNNEENPSVPIPSLADVEKRTIDKTKVENKTKDDQKEDEEPIRIKYNEIQKIEDLLIQVNQQPGHRKVVLENTPETSASISDQKETTPPTAIAPNKTDVPPTSTITNENDDSSAPPKSILKTSQDPSSLDTSTKTSSFNDDQIHVNIEGVQNVHDVLDRLDDAVQTVPVVIDTKAEGEKRQAPQAPNQNDNNNPLVTKNPVPSQKREAPKAPSITNDQSSEKKDNTLQPGEKQKSDDKVSTFKIPEHEFEAVNNNKPASSLSTSEVKKDASGTSDWI